MYYSLCLFSALCAHTLHRSTTNICRPTVLQYGTHSLGELSSTNCQKGPSTIRLRYPVPGTALAGTRTGFEKMAGYTAIQNRISSTSLQKTIKKLVRTENFYYKDRESTKSIKTAFVHGIKEK